MCASLGGNGSFAEECLAAADGAFPVPEGLTDAEAAVFWIPHLTGWIGLVDRGRLVEGDWLAVLGAGGGSGIAAVQLGRALGARVVDIVRDVERDAFCRALSPEETINPATGPRACARDSPMGGIDLLYDPVGGPPRRGRDPGARAMAACSRSASPAASGHGRRPTTW
jgi:NADPH2:quinone reductase